jgi:hypothetical protein
MKLTSLITPAALVVAMSIGAAPALAQGRDQNRARPRESAQSSVNRQDRGGRSAADNRSAAVQRDRGYDARNNDRGRSDSRRYVEPRGDWDRSYRSRSWSGGLLGSLGLRLNIGGVRFGLFAGRPFPYRWEYPIRTYSYRYPFRFVPGISYGGVSFLITPGDAAVYVDGTYVGLASDFYGAQPLPLSPGVHRVELQAEGFAPMLLDLDVMPGHVIPYEGSLRPLF